MDFDSLVSAGVPPIIAILIVWIFTRGPRQPDAATQISNGVRDMNAHMEKSDAAIAALEHRMSHMEGRMEGVKR